MELRVLEPVFELMASLQVLELESRGGARGWKFEAVMFEAAEPTWRRIFVLVME